MRALRIRRRLRQADVASRVGVSRGTISNLERGRISGSSLRVLIAVAGELSADIDVRIRWRGEQLDRLLDEGHARLTDSVVRLLTRDGWETAVEVTFAIGGERGSIDILAFHPRTRALLVIEIRTVVPDAQSMLSVLDRKTRLAARVARERGWQPASVSRLLIIEDGSTARGRVARLSATFDGAFPARGGAVHRWLREPTGAISGLWFVRSATGGSSTSHVAGRQRVRRPGIARNATPGCVPDSAKGLARPNCL